jgi:hypothetical protein
MKAALITRIIYVSTSAGTLPEADLARLHQLSVRRNRQLDITGVLGYTGRYFIQCVEGREASVQELMARIDQDPRHTGVVTLSQEQTPSRWFPSWSMHFFYNPALDDLAQGAWSVQGDAATYAKDLIVRMTDVAPPGASLWLA